MKTAFIEPKASRTRLWTHAPGPLKAAGQPFAGSQPDGLNATNGHEPVNRPAFSRFFSSLLGRRARQLHDVGLRAPLCQES